MSKVISSLFFNEIVKKRKKFKNWTIGKWIHGLWCITMIQSGAHIRIILEES